MTEIDTRIISLNLLPATEALLVEGSGAAGRVVEGPARGMTWGSQGERCAVAAR